MSFFPDDPKKIRARIRSYERKLKKEKEQLGSYGDGYGKRFLLGPLYLLMGDWEGGMKSFDWYEEEFHDSSEEPQHCLCWALALYKDGRIKEAKKKVIDTIFANIHIIPYLLQLVPEKPFEEYDELAQAGIFDRSSQEYAQYMPKEYKRLWDSEALQWLKETYDLQPIQKALVDFKKLNKKYPDEKFIINVYRELDLI